MPSILPQDFFNQEPVTLAVALLGKIIRHRVIDPERGPVWLAAKIIETEAYYLAEKGSHSSLGFTEKRKAMFMAPGTLYMYYARGADSLNFSARGDGNGVLVKSGYPFLDRRSPKHTLEVMRRLNPGSRGDRPTEKLCNGQTLLCRSLGLKVTDWNQEVPDRQRLRIEDVGYSPVEYLQCARLGIPAGRDEHLPYRFVDAAWARFCTQNPLGKPGVSTHAGTISPSSSASG